MPSTLVCRYARPSIPAGAIREMPTSKAMTKSVISAATSNPAMDDGRVRCTWASGKSVDLAYRDYHDSEWGEPVHDDRRLFEFIVLEGAQAGLSWRTVLGKRDNYRRAFHAFDMVRVAAMSDKELEALLGDAGLIRNRLKIHSARSNARAGLAIIKEFGSLDAWLWSFVGGSPHPQPLDFARPGSRHQRGIGRNEQGHAQARLQLRRLDHLLCLHAGHRHGQRSSDHVFPVPEKRRAEKEEAHLIVTRPQDFLDAVADGAFAPDRPATARAAFLVSPLDFSLAAESASDNRYMDLGNVPDPLRALAEHAELARRLAEDVPVVTFPGDPQAADGVFPNNAFATAPGRLIVGHMRHAVRRRETARADIRAWFGDVLGREIIDLSAGNLVAELTGSLVIDRARGIGYCGLGERCDMAGARAMHEAFGLRLTYCFELADGEYHTNVVLAILAGRAAMIAESGFRDGATAKAIATPLSTAARCGSARSRKPRLQQMRSCLSANRVWMSERAASRACAACSRPGIAERGFSIGSVALGRDREGRRQPALLRRGDLLRACKPLSRMAYGRTSHGAGCDRVQREFNARSRDCT